MTDSVAALAVAAVSAAGAGPLALALVFHHFPYNGAHHHHKYAADDPGCHSHAPFRAGRLRAHLDPLGEMILVVGVLAHQQVDQRPQQQQRHRRAQAEARPGKQQPQLVDYQRCLLYTSPSPRD